MGFVEDETPWRGGHVSARVRCVRAHNPSPMTYVGTNSWIVAEPGAKECVVIDPAPAGEQVQRILAACVEAGQFLPFEGAPKFEIVALPGHSEDSVGLLYPAEQSLFTGDVLFRHGPTVVFHPDGVLASYFASLDVLEQLVREGRVQRFYPGHGCPIDNPLPIIEATRKHRVDRLDQVKEALNAGTPADPDALFDVVYQGVNPALRMPSIRSIRAQLKYLGK